MTGCENRSTYNSAGVSYDRLEQATLEIMRCIFVGYAEDSPENFKAAHGLGERYFGSVCGRVLTRALGEYVDAMRRSRRSPFHFSNPRCACCRNRVTTTERRMLDVIQATRDGRDTDAVIDAMAVCDGVCDRRFMDAAATLGWRLIHFHETAIATRTIAAR